MGSFVAKCWLTLAMACPVVAVSSEAASSAEAATSPGPASRERRVLYNFDGCSCMFTKAGGKGPVPVTADDVKRLIEEVAYEGSRVDTVLVCINAQVMFYPTKVGTMLGTPPATAGADAAGKQWLANLRGFYDAGSDPYAVMLAETRQRGREALLSFRMNDDHNVDFQTTQFWVDHPECRLGGKALDFGREEVRDYTFRLIEEAVTRYDCDGIELDFNRFPNFFKDGKTEERVAKMNGLVERVRTMLDDVGRGRGRRLVLSVRPPSNFGNPPPTPETARQRGCDVPAWVANGWVDFVAVSEFLFERGDLPIAEWRRAITTVPVYGGIEVVWHGRPEGERALSADDYRRQARTLVEAGADGVYIFNMFTCRESPPWNEPPFEVFRELGATKEIVAPAADAKHGAATDYKSLSRIQFLPELDSLDLEAKADVIQSLVEKSFFHPSGLFYSMLLIDGPHHLRPMTRADMATADLHGSPDEETAEAAKSEGYTFENSITSAGNYLQSQAARFRATADPAARAEAVRALGSLRLIFDYGRKHGRAGWLGKPYGLVPKDHSTPDQYLDALLGLYRFREIASADERQTIDAMLRDIADFMTRRNYQIWNLDEPEDSRSWNLAEPYCNATYVLAQALAFRATGEEKYRREALRLAGLSHWREESNLDLWRRQGLDRMLMFERVCLGGYVLKAAGATAEILPEVFGDTPEAQADALRRMCSRWWAFCQLGMDGDGYQHYRIDIDVKNGTWRPTGIRPIDKDHPSIPGTFFSSYSDVRWNDQLYRIMASGITVVEHCPELREPTLAWIKDLMAKTNGRRLRWMVDPDGRQLVADCRWMECQISSEAPFHYLTTYWHGRKAGWWD